ncbi:hypothetical protein HPB50_024636 [Hyalomma asiaticum]|uniref:Uncharacterized protein n=1 Tax=Hyalomma asiaticum TaxID=266040 RepID=A0ACB7T1U1_HYAAI|nr:hypothetical protein HPB50_024636 [Hyalomma asiaticum]
MSICANEEHNLAEKYSEKIDEWLDRMAFIEEDMTKMLRIPHNRFWSHAVYDNGFHQVLESYLRLAPRYLGLHRYTITKLMEEADERLHKVMFRVFLRLSTNKESKISFIDKQKFADLIYDNFIFDIPKILDICMLFDRSNHDLVCRMVEHIMNCQPKYSSDLKEIEETTLLAFNRAEQSLNSQDDDDLEATPRRLDEGNAELSELRLMPFQKLLDRITYAVDIAATLSTFFNVYPPAAKIFSLDIMGPRLARYFDATFPVLKEELVRRNKLKSFEPFMFCYQQRYPVEEDIGMFEEYNFFVDNTRSLYILQSISAIYEELGSTPPSNLLNAQVLWSHWCTKKGL